MKISVNDEELFTLNDLQKKVICNDIREPEFDEDMKRRIQYIITHKYEQCFHRLKEEWVPILSSRYQMLPTSEESLAHLIFSQADYKCRHTRELEAEEARKQEASDAITHS